VNFVATLLPRAGDRCRAGASVENQLRRCTSAPYRRRASLRRRRLL